ncbi:MAG: M23 family metallopeptidase [Nitrospinaceae bacterium]
MQKDVFTIVIFPGSTSSPKKYQVSKSLFRCFLGSVFLLLVGFAGSTFSLSNEYLKDKQSDSELASLRRESKIQKIQIDKYGQQVRNFESEMARLARFEKKLRIITALENSNQVAAKNWGVGGPYGLSSASFTTSLERDAQSMLERTSSNLEMLTNQAKIQLISFQELDEYMKNQKTLLSSTPSIWPTRGWVTSGFGYRKSPFTGLPEKHEGLDIAARKGARVLAPADGKINVAGREYGYGNMIQIDHGYGLVTRYGHNSKNLVKPGDRVKRGQVIALVGNTGRSTGPHLHYEIMLHGVPVDPRNYILED